MVSRSVRELWELWRRRARGAFHRGYYIKPSRFTRRVQYLPAQPNVGRREPNVSQRGLTSRRSGRSRRPASLGEGMLTPKEFAAETKRINEEIKRAKTEHIKALAAQQRATEMENMNAKKAANKAVHKAKTEVDLLIEEMYKRLYL